LKQNKVSLRSKHHRFSAPSPVPYPAAEMILTRILDSAGTPWVLIAETHSLTHQAI
jgi:hypothetical protein